MSNPPCHALDGFPRRPGGSLTPRSSMSPCSAAVAVLACRMRPHELGLRVVSVVQCLVREPANKRGACLNAQRFGRNRRNHILRDAIGGTVSRAEAADLLRAFVEDEGNLWEWDDFISVPIADPHLESIRRRCASFPEEFPPTEAGHYCGPRGIEVIEAYFLELRKKN